MLEDLRNLLTAAEQRFREEAFGEAHEFVDRAAVAGGVCVTNKPVMKSFPRRSRRDHRRVDIEVRTGRAFVPDTNSD